MTVSSNCQAHVPSLQMNKTQRNSHENDESKTTPSFFCYHHLCVRYSSVLYWVSKSWISVEQSKEKIKCAWKQPGDKTTIQRFKHRKNHQGCSWYVHSLFFLFYAAYEHSLEFHEFWNVSYHHTMINFAYLTCFDYHSLAIECSCTSRRTSLSEPWTGI